MRHASNPAASVSPLPENRSPPPFPGVNILSGIAQLSVTASKLFPSPPAHKPLLCFKAPLRRPPLWAARPLLT